jgi:perosamine synthetase
MGHTVDPMITATIEQAIAEGGSGNADIVGDLESAFARLIGGDFALCTSSGTAALICALHAAGVRPGDSVAVSALGPAMTGLAVTAAGGRPVFLDTAGPGSFGVDPDAVLNALVHGVKAAVLVPMWGYWDEQPEALALLREHNIPIIVDAAQAPFLQLADGLCETADIVCLSLHGRKPLKAGEGGVCITRRRDLADGIVQERNFGQNAAWTGSRLVPTGPFAAGLGTNFKINAVGAAWCLAQLRGLDQVRQRLTTLRESATAMFDAAGVIWSEAAQSPAVTEHGRYGLVAMCATSAETAALSAHLREHGVEDDTSRYHYRPMYHAPALSSYATECPAAEELTSRATACRLEAFAAAAQLTTTS